MSWKNSFVAFDVETTGLHADAQIVEIACVTFEAGQVVNEWSTLLRPQNVDWDNENVRKAMEVNKIDRAELEDKPTFAEALPDILLELSHPVWVAHNASFDERMLKQELERLGRPAAKASLFSLCTKNLASKLNKTARGNRLFDVACRYQVIQDSAHRAVVDARVCGTILARMIEAHPELPQDDESMRVYIQQARSWELYR